MKNNPGTFIIGLVLLVTTLPLQVKAQEITSNTLPVMGFCISAPDSDDLDTFLQFIREELAPRHINTLILMINYNYDFASHPELSSEGALTKKEARKILKICQENGIRIIPEINLLGHQSWHTHPGKLLEVYPQFDETPHIEFPEVYKWPNDDGLYCKSYCPLHPDVHDVVFDLVDEICEVFEADAFHAGMDEVFYIGDPHCPRCAGRNKAELFAGEVRKIHDHLALSGRELWIWGDRLIDGRTTGLGMWEASMNNTYRAIDMIPKDVFICDWHYERPDNTPVYFAMKGFRVASCPYKKKSVGIAHAENMLRYRSQSTRAMKDNFQGVIQTVWSGCSRFLDQYYGRNGQEADPEISETACFKAMFDVVNGVAEEN